MGSPGALHRLGLWLCLAWCVGLAGCATTRGTAPDTVAGGAFWQGRLAIQVSHPAPRAFAAHFALQGQADRGQLTLSSALGTTWAELEWTPDAAILTTTGEPQRFASLQALAVGATGVDIPIGQLFAWLDGKPGVAPGWEVHLQDHAQGRIEARRTGADLQAELRIVFER